MTAPGASVNRVAALAVCGRARDVEDARLLLDMLGLVVDGALVPDLVSVVAAAGLDAGRPTVVREPPSRRDTVPEGLRNLPPAPPTPPARKRRYSLTEDLEELERTDPAVAAAAASYDRMVERITSKPLPKPDKDDTVTTTHTPPQLNRLAELQDQLTSSGVIAGDGPPPIRPGSSSNPTPGAPYIAALSVVELFVDHGYQRPLDGPRVKRMVQTWDPRMLGIIEVSDRGPAAAPRYAIINGQHRWATAGRVGVEWVACNVHEGLSVEDEARLMFELDRSTKALSSWDKWRSRRASGDTAVLTVERIATGHGMTVTPGGFGAVGAAEQLLRAGGEELLQTTVDILVAAYGPVTSAVKAPMLTGLGQLVQQHGADLAPARMVQALQKVTPEQIRAQADAYRTAMGGSLAAATAVSMAGLYNRTPGPRLAAR